MDRRDVLALVVMATGLWGCQNSNVAATDHPAWLEADSTEAIHQRLLSDFPVSYEVGAAEIIDKYPGMTVDSVCEFIDRHYIETMEIDGERRMFRAAVRNLALLNPNLNGGWQHRGWDASARRISYADSVIRHTAGKLPDGGAHRVTLRFAIDVPAHEQIVGDTLRVWMPYPIESQRQSDINLISTSQPDYVISTPEQSAHRTLYMQSQVAANDTAHFEYVVEFTTHGQYFSPEKISKAIKPYDKTSADYRRYTAFDGPHYVQLDSLAHEIVGAEDNPFRQSELVYDYIVNRYPWAKAREYSTIPCIPQYVVEQGHGDCGQVALLYISLMRSLGVPARWESGWMLHPGELNYHDWAEVYFEGVGWVPIDVSFGRYTSTFSIVDAYDYDAVRNFYSTGIDSYRFATNTDVCDALYPPKRYIRSETVDSQAGEVECSQGNLFYPAWDKTLEIINITPVLSE